MEGMGLMEKLDFYKGKTILITGHTGFKGTWLAKILINAGANVIGYALQAPTTPNIFELSQIEKKMTSIIGDIRDYDHLLSVFREYKPELVIHMAAQPLVRDSYEDPRYTYEVNVMGTVNVLECIRNTDCVLSFLNVTTDKVYLNNDEENYAFKETDFLNGHDPYSNSKSCSELVTQSYKKSFYLDNSCRISTARAGNVIGGGDFAKDRIIPDCIRALENNDTIIIRNPHSTRPYQHVLEPLYVYLDILKSQYENPRFAGYYNVGPDDCDCVTTRRLVELFCTKFSTLKYEIKNLNGPHEASFLKLDNTKIKEVFGWNPVWHIEQTINKIAEWVEYYLNKKSIPEIMDRQINEFFGGIK